MLFDTFINCNINYIYKFINYSVALAVKKLPANSGNLRDVGSIPGSGRFPGEGIGYPLQCSCLENPMDRGAWLATVHGVAKSRTQLSDFHFHTVLSHSYILSLLLWGDKNI